ncbi:MAG: hypothetical protein M5U14_16325 [Acidimicrobiia bacterium]|nr:hypothetical protein [Acidimicrobiia bacterium]
MDFYDQVLRELVAALGAALFVGNLMALLRRRADARRAAAGSGDLAQAPVARTVAYATLGFVMMVAGIAAMVAS